jgi:RNA polymerase sigma-70 factor, ECF subfamily
VNVENSTELIFSHGSEPLIVDSIERSDRDLLKRIAARDKRALREFFLRHETRVRTLLQRISHSRESAAEVVIDTFAAVWHEAHMFRGESRVLIWLFGIAYRRNLACQRTEMAHSESTFEASFDTDSFEITSRPDWLTQAIVRLPFRQRCVIEFAYGLRLSCDEIASVMQCPMKTVNARLLRARRSLDLARMSIPWKLQRPRSGR